MPFGPERHLPIAARDAIPIRSSFCSVVLPWPSVFLDTTPIAMLQAQGKLNYLRAVHRSPEEPKCARQILELVQRLFPVRP
jgi:hypothetical protein